MIESGGDWRSVLGGLHALLVWLPPGLLAAVLLAEFIAFVQRDDGSRLARTALWVTTALATVMAGITGLLRDGGLVTDLAVTAGTDDRHRRFGLLVMAGLLLIAVIEVATPRKARALATGVRVVGWGAGSTLVVLAGLSGLVRARGPEPVAASLPALARPVLDRLAPTAGRPRDVTAIPAAPEPDPPITTSVDAPARPVERWVLDTDLDATSFERLAGAAGTIRTLVVRGLPDDPVLRTLLPVFPEARTVHLDAVQQQLGDAELDFVMDRTPRVRDLMLHGTSVTHRSLARIAAAPDLRRITLWDTAFDRLDAVGQSAVRTALRPGGGLRSASTATLDVILSPKDPLLP